MWLSATIFDYFVNASLVTWNFYCINQNTASSLQKKHFLIQAIFASDANFVYEEMVNQLPFDHFNQKFVFVILCVSRKYFHKQSIERFKIKHKGVETSVNQFTTHISMDLSFPHISLYI